MANFVPYELRDHKGGTQAAQLASGINNSQLSYALATGSGSSYPDGSSGPFIISIDADSAGMEKIRCTSRTADTLFSGDISDRGFDGTSAVSHAQGATVKHGWSAGEATEVVKVGNNTLGRITTIGDLLYADTTATLQRRGIGSAGQVLTVSGGLPVWAANAAQTQAAGDLRYVLLSTALNKGDLLVASGAGAVTILPASGVPGQVLTSQGTNQTPAFQTLAQATGPLATVDFTGTTASTLTTSLVAQDTTNLSPSFNVPASGKVLVRASGVSDANTTAGSFSFAWLNHSGGAQVGRTQTRSKIGTANDTTGFSVAQTLSGLTPGAGLRLDFAASFTTGAVYHLTDVTLEVWAS